jgi:hypothetical protein
MKTLIVLAIALTSFSAQAESFQCTARGYDQNNFMQTVRGFMRPSEFSARQSALQSCRLRGWTNCFVTLCHRWP